MPSNGLNPWEEMTRKRKRKIKLKLPDKLAKPKLKNASKNGDRRSILRTRKRDVLKLKSDRKKTESRRNNAMPKELSREKRKKKLMLLLLKLPPLKLSKMPLNLNLSLLLLKMKRLSNSLPLSRKT